MFFPSNIVVLLSLLSSPVRSAFALPWATYIHNDGYPTPNPPDGHWVDTWTSMPQLTEPANLPPQPFNQTDLVFFNTTLRQTFHITTPSTYLRLRLSNAFGGANLPITAATIAVPLASGIGNGNLTGSSLINTTTVQHLTFSGEAEISIPPGALAVSDPIYFPVHANQILSISLYLANGQSTQSITSHPGSRTSSYLSRGDWTASKNLTDSSTQEVFHWYFISALEAWSEPAVSSFVVVGDSITDGRSSYNNANGRWTDLLFNRLHYHSSSTNNPALGNIAVSNQAAGGNRVLADGAGPSALSRIERDVIAHPGVKYAMTLEGVNDIGTAMATMEAQRVVGDALIQAYKQMFTRMHTAGIAVFGGYDHAVWV